jgi:Lrp/AsnC family leucine-responsive transcriptional regulator
MHNTPIGPTGAAMLKPNNNPFSQIDKVICFSFQSFHYPPYNKHNQCSIQGDLKRIRAVFLTNGKKNGILNGKSKDNLDLTDLHILQALQQNARASYREIGAQVGLTGPAVAERVHRLEEAGVINGYTLALNAVSLGLSIQAFIQLTAPATRYPRVLETLKDVPGILECHHVTGGASFLIHAVAGSTQELETIISHISPFGETTTSLVLSTPIKKDLPTHTQGGK